MQAAYIPGEGMVALQQVLPAPASCPATMLHVAAPAGVGISQTEACRTGITTAPVRMTRDTCTRHALVQAKPAIERKSLLYKMLQQTSHNKDVSSGLLALAHSIVQQHCWQG